MSSFESGQSLQRVALLVLVAVACFMAPRSSEAQILDSLLPENKIVPGAACAPTNTKAFANFELRASGIKNVSTAAQWVTCSLVTDSEGAWNTYSVPLLVNGHANIHVTLDYSNVPQLTGTTCVAQVIVDSAVGESATATINGNAGTPSLVLSIEDLTLGSAEGSPVAVSCLLPPNVKLNAVRLEEVSITDLNTTPIL